MIQARHGIPLDAFRKSSEVLHEGTPMVKDKDRCVGCGRCAERCPTRAIAMEAFRFEEALVCEEGNGQTPEMAGERQ